MIKTLTTILLAFTASSFSCQTFISREEPYYNCVLYDGSCYHPNLSASNGMVLPSNTLYFDQIPCPEYPTYDSVLIHKVIQSNEEVEIAFGSISTLILVLIGVFFAKALFDPLWKR